MKKFISNSENETLRFAEKFTKKLKGGETIALTGELGSGKTVFTKGVAKALKIKEHISSPTFNIFKIYETSHLKLCHIDAYRLNSAQNLVELGIKDYIKSNQIITLIEWAEKVKKILPQNTIFVNFKPGEKDNQRIITINCKEV